MKVAAPYDAYNRDAVTALVGKPYVTGVFDCWSLVEAVRRDIMHLPTPDYSARTGVEDRSVAAYDIWYALSVDPWRPCETYPGAVCVFRIGRWHCHTGVSLGGMEFIHCLQGRNTTIERLDRDGWAERLEGVFTWGN